MKLRRQLSVLLDNRPGVLGRVAGGLARRKVNILAVSVTDTVGHCILRLVVDNPRKAKPILKKEAAKVLEQSVVAGEVPNARGTLAKLGRKLGSVQVNIHYVYGSASPKQHASFLVFGTDNNRKAAKVLRKV